MQSSNEDNFWESLRNLSVKMTTNLSELLPLYNIHLPTVLSYLCFVLQMQIAKKEKMLNLFIFYVHLELKEKDNCKSL